MPARSALVLAILVGCAYRPGSYSHFNQSFPGQRTTIGCIDLAIERRADLRSGGAILAYEFGNRCDHPATIDLASVKVLAQSFSGERFQLAPYDPDGEIRALRLDGRMAGKEAIAYPADAQLAQVCVNAASITQGSTDRWLCFSTDVPPDPAPYVLPSASAGETPAVAEVSP